MEEIKFELGQSEFIALNQLLKTTGVVYSGGEAKMMIQNQMVEVNDVIELQLRKKIRKGDVVIVESKRISVF